MKNCKRKKTKKEGKKEEIVINKENILKRNIGKER